MTIPQQEAAGGFLNLEIKKVWFVIQKKFVSQKHLNNCQYIDKVDKL